MKRSEKRILTTHVGSLVRTSALKAMARARAGQLETEPDTRDLETVRHATVEVVRKQAAIGIDIVSDGEFGKSSWSGYILSRLTGFEVRPHQLRPMEWLGRDLDRFRDVIAREMPEALKGRPAQVCTGPIAYREHEPVQRAIRNFQDALDGVKVEEAFLTAVAPASTAYDGVNEYYASDRDYVFALAEALREEYLEIYKAGLLLQVDDAVLANMYDHLVQQSPERYREWAQLRVDAVNHALRGIPEDRVRITCASEAGTSRTWPTRRWKKWPGSSPRFARERIRSRPPIRATNTNGASGRMAGFRRGCSTVMVWCVMTPGMRILPGVVADRIIRYANAVGPHNVIAGADCGFAQIDVVERVPSEVMWAKFESLVEGAAIASRELF